MTHPVTTNPATMDGQPRVAGTRVPVSALLREVAARVPMEEILKAWPHLTETQVREAVRWAGERLRVDYKA